MNRLTTQRITFGLLIVLLLAGCTHTGAGPKTASNASQKPEAAAQPAPGGTEAGLTGAANGIQPGVSAEEDAAKELEKSLNDLTIALQTDDPLNDIH